MKAGKGLASSASSTRKQNIQPDFITGQDEVLLYKQSKRQTATLAPTQQPKPSPRAPKPSPKPAPKPAPRAALSPKPAPRATQAPRAAQAPLPIQAKNLEPYSIENTLLKREVSIVPQQFKANTEFAFLSNSIYNGKGKDKEGRLISPEHPPEYITDDMLINEIGIFLEDELYTEEELKLQFKKADKVEKRLLEQSCGEFGII